jgi:hypothetical protein
MFELFFGGGEAAAEKKRVARAGLYFRQIPNFSRF